MGVGRQQGRASLAVILALPRPQQRAQVAEEIALLNDWLAKRDSQDATARDGFAAGLPGAFAAFVAALPDPPVDQTP